MLHLQFPVADPSRRWMSCVSIPLPLGDSRVRFGGETRAVQCEGAARDQTCMLFVEIQLLVIHLLAVPSTQPQISSSKNPEVYPASLVSVSQAPDTPNLAFPRPKKSRSIAPARASPEKKKKESN